MYLTNNINILRTNYIKKVGSVSLLRDNEDKKTTRP